MTKRRAEMEDLSQFKLANPGNGEDKQGPFPPWCVGSIFSPPQLVTSDSAQSPTEIGTLRNTRELCLLEWVHLDIGSLCTVVEVDVCPLTFNPVGKPECILSTGHDVKLYEPATTRTKDQANSFMLSSTSPFVPSALLQDHLNEDAALRRADCKSKTLSHGNRMEAVKTGDKIGSALCYPRVNGAWYPTRKSSTLAICDRDEEQWSVSSSLRQPALQLSAVLLQPDRVGDHGHVYVAARTAYQVHFCIVLRKEERLRFASTYVATFRTRVSHVAWNPHLDREAAVLLENGEVSLFDLPIWTSGFTDSIVELEPRLIVESPMHKFGRKSVVQRRDSVSMTELEPLTAGNEEGAEIEGVDKVGTQGMSCWRCEFAWHPQILLVSGLREVIEVDYRRMNILHSPVQGTGSANLHTPKCSGDVRVLAEVIRSDACGRFCFGKSTEEQILAFARADYDEMCKFSVATEKHLMLYDVRRTGTPILQWEHGMTQEPPDLLVMCKASALQGSLVGVNGRDYKNGRVIMAVSFQSGDIRLFYYGSKVSKNISVIRENTTREDCDWYEKTYAWEIPLKFYPPKSVTNDWSDLLASSEGQFSKKVQGSLESKRGLECISGIVLLSRQLSQRTTSNPKRGFTMLQLTGSGDILLQQYKVSDQTTVIRKSGLDTILSVPEKGEGNEVHEPRFVILGAFLRYIQKGRTLGKGGTRSLDGLDHMGKVEKPKSTEETNPPELKTATNFNDDHLRIQLRTILQHLNLPLSMYEITHAVLRMGLPAHLLPSAARMPSDLERRRHGGYKPPLVLPLLYSGPPSESVSHHDKGDKGVPLPSLLEIQHRDKAESIPSMKSNGEEVQECGNGTGDGGKEEDPPTVVDVAERDFPSSHGGVVSGQKLLLESCSYLERSLKGMSGKHTPSVVSLSDPSENWLGGEVDDKALLYEISMDIFNKLDDGINVSNVDVKSQQPFNLPKVDKGLEVADEELRRSISQNRLCNFVAGKYPKSRENDKAKRLSDLDRDTCPIKLSFICKTEGVPLDEQLDDEEFTAIGSLQTQLKEWQKSLTVYSEPYG